MVLRVGPSSKIGFEFSEVTRLDMIEPLSAERRERRSSRISCIFTAPPSRIVSISSESEKNRGSMQGATRGSGLFKVAVPRLFGLSTLRWQLPAAVDGRDCQQFR